MEKSRFDFIKDIEFGLLRAQFTVQEKYLKKFAQHLFYTQDTLYHYTDLNGLLGILTNKGFWLSEAKYLNDKEELYNGRNLTIELIQILLTKSRYSNFKDVLLKTVHLLKESKFNNYYIASFSSQADDLEQWRAYSKNGTGTCIGFDLKQKTDFPHFLLGPVWMLHKVIYDDNIKCRILHLIIFKYFYEFRKDLKQDLKYIDIDDYATSLASSLTYTFINFKHKSFAQEKEVRLVCNKDNVLKSFHHKFHRIVNNSIVPYICTYDIILKHQDGSQVAPDLLPVSEVYLGPTNNQDKALESIKSFMSNMGYAESIVENSKIPYRG